METQALSLDVVGREPFRDASAGARLLAAIGAHAPMLLPARYGTHEPFAPLRGDDPTEIVEHPDWGSKSMYWQARDGRTDGSVIPRQFDFDALSYVTLDRLAVPDDPEPLVDLLIALAQEFRPSLGTLHLLGPADIERGYAGDYVVPEDLNRPSDYLTLVGNVERFLPDLFWCTVLGPPYVDLFGRDALEAIDLHDARFLRDDLFFLRFSEHPSWVVEHADEFEATRSRLKAALRPEAFFSEERGPDGSYLVPDFAAVPT